MATTASSTPLDQLLTISQAAAILAVNERMVRRLIESRRISFIKVGRHVRFREVDLVQAMSAWTIPSASRPGTRRP